MAGLKDILKAEADSKKYINPIIQTEEELIVTAILNKMFYCEKNIDKEVQFVRHVMTRGQETAERKGLHASAITKSDSKFCLRAQVLSLVYRQIQGDNINVGLKRIFEEGNSVHEKWQRLFIRSGYAEPLDCDKTEFCKPYMLSYTPDIIANMPEISKYPVVVEIKSMRQEPYKKLKINKEAASQSQFYMFLRNKQGLKTEKAISLTENKNDQEFLVNIDTYDLEKNKKVVDRLEKIVYNHDRLVNQGKLVKRPPDASMDSKKCKQCPMYNACYNLPGGKEKL